MATAMVKAKTKQGKKAREAETISLPPGTLAVLSAKQIAAALDMSERHLYELIAIGKYPPPDSRPNGEEFGPLGRLTRWKVSTHNRWFVANFGADAEDS